MSSAAEVALVSLLNNDQDASPITTKLIEMNHTQPPNLIQVENSIALGIVNEAIKQRMSKAR